MDLRVKELDDFRAPVRRPWLPLVLLILVVGAVFGIRRMRRARDAAPATEEEAFAPGERPVAAAHAVPREREGFLSGRRGVERAPLTAGTSETSPDKSLSAAESRDMLARAVRLESEDNLPDARELYFKLLAAAPSEAVRRDVEQRLGRLNIELLTTPRMMPEKIEYMIRAGDSLQRIAQQHGTTIELLEKSNRIANRNLIKIGDRLRVLNRPEFAIHVRKSANDLLLTLNGRFFKRYKVGTGEFGRTPEGTFEVRAPTKNPAWYHPDGRIIPFGHPDNILGTRWMSIIPTGDTPPGRGYGIHGTWEEESVGTQSSAGCVRMRNADVEELFMIVTSGTPVTIVK